MYKHIHALIISLIEFSDVSNSIYIPIRISVASRNNYVMDIKILLQIKIIFY